MPAPETPRPSMLKVGSAITAAWLNGLVALAWEAASKVCGLRVGNGEMVVTNTAGVVTLTPAQPVSGQGVDVDFSNPRARTYNVRLGQTEDVPPVNTSVDVCTEVRVYPETYEIVFVTKKLSLAIDDHRGLIPALGDEETETSIPSEEFTCPTGS